MNNQIIFTDDKVKVRRLFFWSTLMLALLALIAGLMLYLVGERLFILIEIISGFAMVVFLASLAFLLFYYITRPEVREKRDLKRQLDNIQKEMGRAQQDLAGALHIIRTIRDRYRDQQDQTQERHNALSNQLQQKIDDLHIAQEQELANELALIQKEYLEEGLKEVTLDPAELPGIGPMLAEKLELAGICTALDVTQDAIEAIPGFGESKILSLVRWRESLEYKLLSEQPTQIGDETQDTIHEKYSQQILSLQEEMMAAQTALDQRLEELRLKEAEELANAAGTEISARQTLSNLEAHKKETQEQLDQYEHISLTRLILTILSIGQNQWQRQLISFLWLITFLILGIANVAILITTLT
jgi:DNA-binding helix-hairpin-helix protein with protein kinase domain